jgi:1,4-alpha-glucan branching enzyme
MNRMTLYALLLLLLAGGCDLVTPRERPGLEGRNLVLWMPGASSVQVLADWNEWGGLVSPGGVIDPSSGAMTKDESGFWVLDISHLRGGTYRYVYLVNGYRWIPDSTNPLTSLFHEREVSLIMISD